MHFMLFKNNVNDTKKMCKIYGNYAGSSGRAGYICICGEQIISL